MKTINRMHATVLKRHCAIIPLIDTFAEISSDFIKANP